MSNNKIMLWEILVPTVRNDGRPIRTRFHKVWDDKIRKISGGLTVMTAAKGQWINQDNELLTERMIPVRIIANEEQINEIIKFTITYYEQQAILAYKISDDVRLVHRDDINI